MNEWGVYKRGTVQTFSSALLADSARADPENLNTYQYKLQADAARADPEKMIAYQYKLHRNASMHFTVCPFLNLNDWAQVQFVSWKLFGLSARASAED